MAALETVQAIQSEMDANQAAQSALDERRNAEWRAMEAEIDAIRERYRPTFDDINQQGNALYDAWRALSAALDAALAECTTDELQQLATEINAEALAA
ncbi:hypothetical protein [Rhodomicrobium lacus]|uniref:hypothetical protein n=1 Tax=Rhodomicrobium lacus TaxID=2498452 RepID=UPI000F8E1DE1|nr:hypothetical protein [Rhodomicrobium lacus]